MRITDVALGMTAFGLCNLARLYAEQGRLVVPCTASAALQIEERYRYCLRAAGWRWDGKLEAFVLEEAAP